ncbi:cytidine deaminase [Paenibacillus sp. MMS20-IR301]|uniref:cytidine deaminase n=1 Tax=Paenibacillus sp. MMS20-IR301 TaxID=2895946 RepID=UPI0028EEF791|nr:cytidine deaminase [Paenibacillus sp. MMS20-IR301]WNS44915.1 cytidine deaminase [Paenibacillus sp. MMS20-IR301]
MKVEQKDRELIQAARETIDRNFDLVNERHTVGAAVRCKNGNIYTGVNLYSIHGSCAEFIAIGAAITAGEREFETIVAARTSSEGGVLLPPCGNCREMLVRYAPDIEVLMESDNGAEKFSIQELIPRH